MINLCDEVGNLASEGADEQDRVGSLPAKEKLWCWGYGVADFGDDSGRLNTFALSLEIEEDAVTECGEQHGINVRKGDIVTFVKEGTDFSSQGLSLGRSEYPHRGGHNASQYPVRSRNPGASHGRVG